MIDMHLVRAARGAALEAAGTLLRNEDLADRGRLEQYRNLRRRQVDQVRRNWGTSSALATLPSIPMRLASTVTGRKRD